MGANPIRASPACPICATGRWVEYNTHDLTLFIDDEAQIDTQGTTAIGASCSCDVLVGWRLALARDGTTSCPPAARHTPHRWPRRGRPPGALPNVAGGSGKPHQIAKLCRAGRPDLNRRHPAPKAGALPTALRPVPRRKRRKAEHNSRNSACAHHKRTLPTGCVLSRQRRLLAEGRRTAQLPAEPRAGISARAYPAAQPVVPRTRPAPRSRPAPPFTAGRSRRSTTARDGPARSARACSGQG